MAASFTERLQSLIDKSGKSMTVIGDDLGVSKQTISAWYVGRRKPKPITISIIAEYFGVSKYWLMGLSEEMQPSNLLEINSVDLTFSYTWKDKDGQRYSIRFEHIDGEPTLTIGGVRCDFAKVYAQLDPDIKVQIASAMLKYAKQEKR